MKVHTDMRNQDYGLNMEVEAGMLGFRGSPTLFAAQMIADQSLGLPSYLYDSQVTSVSC